MDNFTELPNAIGKLIDENSQLRRENEQLTKKNKSLEFDLERIYEMTHLNEFVDQIKTENLKNAPIRVLEAEQEVNEDDAPEGYIAVADDGKDKWECTQCSFDGGHCPADEDGNFLCAAGNRADNQYVIFKKKDHLPVVDPDEAPRGLIAVAVSSSEEPRSCSGCCFQLNGCPTNKYHRILCVKDTRNDGCDVIFKEKK